MSFVKNAALFSSVWHAVSIIALAIFLIYLKVKENSQAERIAEDLSPSKSYALVFRNSRLIENGKLYIKKAVEIVTLPALDSKWEITRNPTYQGCCPIWDNSSDCEMIICLFAPFGLFILPFKHIGWRFIVMIIFLFFALVSCVGIITGNSMLLKPLLFSQAFDVTVCVFYLIYRSYWLGSRIWAEILISTLGLIFKVILCKVQLMGFELIRDEEKSRRNFLNIEHNVNRIMEHNGDSNRSTPNNERNQSMTLHLPGHTLTLVQNPSRHPALFKSLPANLASSRSADLASNNSPTSTDTVIKFDLTNLANVRQTPPPSYENAYAMPKPITKANDFPDIL
ncbi:unnamed protein product [Gordionus sp. m RMFG-2023]